MRTRRHDQLIHRARRIVEERDAALLSLDERKIRAYMARHRIRPPLPEDFWPGVHKARARNTNQPMVERQLSVRWLMDHDYLAPGAEDVPV